MSWKATSWAKSVVTGSPSLKALLLVLADYADESHSCFPSQETLAVETEQSVRTVRRQLKQLEEESKLITRERRFDAGGHRTSDRFILQIPTGQSDRLDSRPTGQAAVRLAPSLPDTPGSPTGHQRSSLPDTAMAEEPPVEPPMNKKDSSALASEPDQTKTNGKRGTRLDPNWVPTQATVAAMRAELPHFDTQREHRRFVDYWIARSGAAGVKRDWDATWRNWMRTSAERSRTSTQPQRPDPVYTTPPPPDPESLPWVRRAAS